MPIEIDEVRRIAELAHLEMDDVEAGRLLPQIAAILDHVAAVSRLDVGEVPPMASPGTSAPPREDEVTPSLPVEKALDPAPAHDAGHFVVPRVMRR